MIYHEYLGQGIFKKGISFIVYLKKRADQGIESVGQLHVNMAKSYLRRFCLRCIEK